jgi:sugar lactone lactonase YvrE
VPVLAPVHWKGLGAAILVAGLLAAGIVVLLRTTSEEGENPYAYDLSAYQKVDPALIRYREEGTFDVSLPELRGLAVDRQDRILVAGRAETGVLLRFDPRGRKENAFPLGGVPGCCAVGPGGEIYLGITDHVEVLDPAGGRTRAWNTLGEKGLITSIAAGPGDVYVADAGQFLLWRFDAEGNLKGMIGRKNPAAGEEGFVIPGLCFDALFDPKGRLWVVDPGRHRVQHRSPEGTVLSQWGRYGFEIENFSGC